VEIIICSIVAFISGAVDAIAGGGGAISFPALLMLGYPVSTIVATSKFMSTFGTAAAVYTYVKNQKTNPELYRPGIIPTAIGALIGAYLVTVISNQFLKPVAVVLIFVFACYSFFRPKLGTTNSYHGTNQRMIINIMLAAFIFGAYDGFFGPGTGTFWTFLFVRYVGLDFIRAAGNTKILNLVSNFVPLVYFLFIGNIMFDLGIPMAIANIAGGFYGSKLALRKGAGAVRWVFIIMAVVLVIKIVVLG
jgi:uncharacterized membrane protein YfcA